MPGLEGENENLEIGGADEGADAGGAGEDSGGDDGESPYAKGSMESTALATFREINKRAADEGEAGEDAADGGEGEGEPEDTGLDDQGKPKPGYVKDPATGRFVKPPAGAAAAPGAQGKPHDTLPRTWKREMADAWKALPENVRQEVYRREQDALNGVTQYRQGAENFDHVAREVIGPHMASFEAVGQSPRQALPEIVGTWSRLIQGDEPTRVGILLQLADDLGINRAAFGAPQNSGQQHQRQGDNVELTNANRRIDQLETSIRNEREQRERNEIAGLADEFNRFRADPKNEFIDQVAPTMQRLLSIGQATTYRDAYEQACQLDAGIRETLRGRTTAQEAKDALAVAAKARKAGGANVPSRGSPAPGKGPSTMVDTARSVFRNIQARNGR
jgi:hypothetical protein